MTTVLDRPPIGLAAIAPARAGDVPALVALETRCFEPADRIDRRGFRHFVATDTADLLVARDPSGAPAGYALLLYRRGTLLARLYSIAVDPQVQGHGLGRLLLAAATEAALERDCVLLRLEVRPDNAAAIALYEAEGFRPFGRFLDYYADHSDALRLQKRLRGTPVAGPVPPYYAQTTRFTCGPAAVMMAMAALDPGRGLDRATELRLWREANTVYMGSGHGGCEPLGLAIALARRGFAPEVFSSHEWPLFLDSVRQPDKRDVMAVTQADFRDEAEAMGIPVHLVALDQASLRNAVESGAVVLVLVSHDRMTGERGPHWVVAWAHDGRRVMIHDPWPERTLLESPHDAAALPVPLPEFERMARYGRARLRTAVVVRRGPLPDPGDLP